MKLPIIIIRSFIAALAVLLAFSAFISCRECTEERFTEEELELITEFEDSIMRVLQTPVEEDSIFLRRKALPVSEKMMRSKEYTSLCNRMLQTVQNPANEGVGIAAPQVGISRKLIAVQRFDKPGEPFELYANPEIVRYGLIVDTIAEGCLSVPDRRGKVVRSHQIDLRYSNLNTGDTVETISGYTAVIFQHEVDHLNGIIYTDRIDSTLAE